MAFNKNLKFLKKSIKYTVPNGEDYDDIRNYSRERLYNLCPVLLLLESVCGLLLSQIKANTAKNYPTPFPHSGKEATILDLPDSVLRHIIKFTDPDDIDLFLLSTVSQRFRDNAQAIFASKENRSFDFVKHSRKKLPNLADLVGHDSPVKKLTINGRSDRLTASALRMPQLKELHLSNVSVDADFVTFLQSNEQLRVLSLYNVIMAFCLSDAIDLLPNLRFLRMWGLTVPTVARGIDCFSKLRNLHALHVAFVDDNMTKLILDRVFAAGAPLETLVISKSAAMGESLCQFTSLRTLRIESLNDDSHELGELALRLVNMTEIEVVGATVTRCIEMAFLVGEKLQKIRLEIVRDGDRASSFMANLDILKEVADDSGISLNIVYKTKNAVNADAIPAAYLEENSSWLKPQTMG